MTREFFNTLLGADGAVHKPRLDFAQGGAADDHRTALAYHTWGADRPLWPPNQPEADAAA